MFVNELRQHKMRRKSNAAVIFAKASEEIWRSFAAC